MSDLINLRYEECKKYLGSDKFCIAGGAISDYLRGISPCEFDCFFINQGEYNNAVEFISYRAKEVVKRKNSTKFKTIDGFFIDVVFTGKESFLDTIEAFDLVHSCHYYTPKDGVVSLENAKLYSELGIIHLKTITLPYFTLGRIAKFKNRGFIIDSNQESQILNYCYKAPWGPLAEMEYNL